MGGAWTKGRGEFSRVLLQRSWIADQRWVICDQMARHAPHQARLLVSARKFDERCADDIIVPASDKAGAIVLHACWLFTGKATGSDVVWNHITPVLPADL